MDRRPVTRANTLNTDLFDSAAIKNGKTNAGMSHSTGSPSGGGGGGGRRRSLRSQGTSLYDVCNPLVGTLLKGSSINDRLNVGNSDPPLALVSTKFMQPSFIELELSLLTSFIDGPLYTCFLGYHPLLRGHHM